MKKSEELKAKLDNLKIEAKSIINEGNAEKASAKLQEIKDTQALLDTQLEIERIENEEIGNKLDNKSIKTNRQNAIKEFATSARQGFKASMNEGTKSDGGYTVPEEISTMINEYKTAKASLLDYVEIKPVSTNSGERTFKKRSQQAGFSKVTESGKMSAVNTPQFERQEWKIDKYAGYMPVTEELLEDSDVNIATIIANWFADESRVTANKLIVAELQKLTSKEVSDIDDIKKILNVTLGQAFKSTSKIITNDDGLQWLDTLKDNDGKYLLATNPSNPMEMCLCAGATTVPVVVIPNSDLPTTEVKNESTVTGYKIPMIIGDLKEAVTYFDRKHYSLVESNVAVVGELNAFEQGLTLYKATEREDVEIRDNEAVINAYVAVSAG